MIREDEKDIFAPFDMAGKSKKPVHSSEFLAILEQASVDTAIRAITHSRPLLVFWVTPEGEVLDAGNEHFANPPKGDKTVLSSPTHKGHLRGRAALIGNVVYVVVYGDHKTHALSPRQIRLLQSSCSKILSKLQTKGLSRQLLSSVMFIQEDGQDVDF